MIEEHPVFERPSDPNAVIWRYMDFTKFVDLLETRTLFFSRADLLGDPFEGSFPEMNIVLRPQAYAGIPEGQKFFPKIVEFRRKAPKTMAINCWHLNDSESAAMWRIYLKSDEGIAIRSTYYRLVSALMPVPERIFVGLVKYIDYRIDAIREDNLFYPFVHKRKSFEHERELRCVIYKPYPTKPNKDPDDDPIIDSSKDPLEAGIRIGVDLDELLTGIFVAPSCPSWILDLTKAVARKYTVKAPVFQSDLRKEPLY